METNNNNNSIYKTMGYVCLGIAAIVSAIVTGAFGGYLVIQLFESLL